MPTTKKTGRGPKARVGWIAVGYDPEEKFWYSSGGVFSTAAGAKNDLRKYYPGADRPIRAIKIILKGKE